MGWETSNVAATVGQGVPQFNPLQTVGNIATIQNQINQNRLFQAQQAGGNALLNATGPDGAINQGSLRNNLMGMGPNAGLVAAQTLGQGQDLQRGGLANAGTRISTMQAALANIPPVNPADPTDVARFNRQYNATLQAGAKQGLWSSDDAANAAGGNINGLTPQEVQRQATLRAGNAPQLEQAVGQASLQDIGSGFQPIITKIGPDGSTVAPIPGAPVIAKGVAPGIASIDTGPNVKTFATPAIQPGETGVTPIATTTKDIGPGAQVFVPNPAEPGGGHYALTSPHGPVQNQPLIGAAPAAEAVAVSSAQQLAQARAQAATVNTRVLTLKKALSGLQGANTGPGTDFTNNVSSFLQSQVPFGLGKILPGVNPNAIKNRDEADKYLTQYAMAQSSQFGPTTDSRLATALTGNASTHISNLAARDVVKTNIGIERMGAAAQAAFDASGQPPENASKYFAQWGRTVDPAAFVADLQTKAQRQAYMKTLKPADKSQYLQGLRQALQTGMISETDLAK